MQFLRDRSQLYNNIIFGEWIIIPMITKKFLDERFDQEIDGIYYAHQPIYGYRSNNSSGSDIPDIC